MDTGNITNLYQNERPILGLASNRSTPKIPYRKKKHTPNAPKQSTAQGQEEDTDSTSGDGAYDATLNETSPSSDTEEHCKHILKTSSASTEAHEHAAETGQSIIVNEIEQPYGLCPKKDKEHTQIFLENLQKKYKRKT